MKKVKCFHPFTISRISKVEKWLSDKSEQGLCLIQKKGWVFIFAECTPKKRRYFLYVSPLSERKDCYLKDFYRARKLFALKNSSLSENDIFEIDINKTDDTIHTFFYSRTKAYLKAFVKLLIAEILIGATLLSVSIFNSVVWSIAIISCLPIVYSAFNIFYLRSSIRKAQKNI